MPFMSLEDCRSGPEAEGTPEDDDAHEPDDMDVDEEDGEPAFKSPPRDSPDDLEGLAKLALDFEYPADEDPGDDGDHEGEWLHVDDRHWLVL